MSKTKKVLIVSRHKSTIQLLKQILQPIDIDVDVVEHIDNPEILAKYPIVIGNLPLSMYARLPEPKRPELFLVSLEIPRELRGRELGIEELKKYVTITAVVHIAVAEGVVPIDIFNIDIKELPKYVLSILS